MRKLKRVIEPLIRNIDSSNAERCLAFKSDEEGGRQDVVDNDLKSDAYAIGMMCCLENVIRICLMGNEAYRESLVCRKYFFRPDHFPLV